MSDTVSSAQFQRRWTSLLSGTLETWVYQLLYQRHVYPKETFACSKFLGVRVHLNRQPAVVSYVRNTIKVAAPSLVAGVADIFSLVIIETDEHDCDADGEVTARTNAREIEKYVIRFSNDSCRSSDKITLGTIEVLERGMRDLILAVNGLPSERTTSSDSVSFKLSLHIPSKDTSCTEL